MEQLSAYLHQCSVKDSNTSRRVTTSVPTLWLVLAFMTMPMLSTADDNTSDSHYKDLGHRVICTCDRQAPIRIR